MIIILLKIFIYLCQAWNLTLFAKTSIISPIYKLVGDFFCMFASVKKNDMNKKLIIGLVVAGLVIAGGVYLYNRNKAIQKQKNMATESDATDFLDLNVKRGNQPLNPNELKDFVNLYTANIDKDLHKRLMVIIGKKESEFNSKDKLDLTILKEKVTIPVRDLNKNQNL